LHSYGIQVSEQPLTFGALTVNGCKQVRYNVRKLSELPYHLIESGMEAELRKHVLFNYDWLHSKLAAASLPDVLADFHMATTSFSDAAKVLLIQPLKTGHATFKLRFSIILLFVIFLCFLYLGACYRR